MLHFPLFSICFHFFHCSEIFTVSLLPFKKKLKQPLSIFISFLLCCVSSDFLHAPYCIFTIACSAAKVLTLESYLAVEYIKEQKII